MNAILDEIDSAEFFQSREAKPAADNPCPAGRHGVDGQTVVFILNFADEFFQKVFERD